MKVRCLGTTTPPNPPDDYGTMGTFTCCGIVDMDVHEYERQLLQENQVRCPKCNANATANLSMENSYDP